MDDMDILEKKKEPRVKDGVYNPDSGMPPPFEPDDASAVRRVKPKVPAPKKMAKGGYVKAADGCASRGKTRGKMV